jgi:hypothetical protein
MQTSLGSWHHTYNPLCCHQLLVAERSQTRNRSPSDSVHATQHVVFERIHDWQFLHDALFAQRAPKAELSALRSTLQSSDMVLGTSLTTPEPLPEAKSLPARMDIPRDRASWSQAFHQHHAMNAATCPYRSQSITPMGETVSDDMLDHLIQDSRSGSAVKCADISGQGVSELACNVTNLSRWRPSCSLVSAPRMPAWPTPEASPTGAQFKTPLPAGQLGSEYSCMEPAWMPRQQTCAQSVPRQFTPATSAASQRLAQHLDSSPVRQDAYVVQLLEPSPVFYT